jgi:hypothetical protein
VAQGADQPERPERDPSIAAFLLQAAFDTQRQFGYVGERLSRIEERTARLEERTDTLVNEVSELRLDVKALRRDLPTRRELWAAAAFIVTSAVAIAGVAVR